MYVIKRVPDGAYVALPGSRGSYTSYLQRAQTFHSREEAERHRCPGNEVVVPVEGWFNKRG